MALAVDFDGTLASEGVVSSRTIEALSKFKASGRKLVMVTGRRLDDLKNMFDRLDLFDRIVAENGALIYTPQTQVQRLLGAPPSEQFINQLRSLNVEPLYIGNVIVATVEPHEAQVLKAIRDLGLGLEIIFNKGAVMVLPSGINKATGLVAALNDLEFSTHHVIGIGDAENDHVFLHISGLGVAVANACESVKQSSELVTQKACGEGVEELIDQVLKNESSLVSKVKNRLYIGLDSEGVPAELIPNESLLIAGNSGIGKSTLATALTEKMVENASQFCVFDPEGDYEKLENAIGVGDIKSQPSLVQVMELLQDSSMNIVVNTLGVDFPDRPSFFSTLAPKLISLKSRTGRPHWLIIDEAHHLVPAAQESTPLPKEGVILITVHPEEIAKEILKTLNSIIILGPQAPTILEKVSHILGEPLPSDSLKPPQENEVLMWQRTPVSLIRTIKADKPKQQHKRHIRKYALGDLDEEYSFYFRGQHNTLHLRAQNLAIFLQIAEGIDDETWMFHLKKNDYSNWFKQHIKDNILAEATIDIENNHLLSPLESRQAIAELVKGMYTAPASSQD